MNMFKPTDAKSVEEYIDFILEPRKNEIIALHKFIQKKLPADMKPHLVGNMIGYGNFHYKYASGREVDWPIISLASQKNYISVYICASDGDQYVAEKYKSKLPNASIGKSCIRFKHVSDIDLDVLQQVLEEAINTPNKTL